MSRPRPATPPPGNVISLAAARSPRAAEPEESDPYDVLECMINGYYTALQVQMQKVFAARERAQKGGAS